MNSKPFEIPTEAEINQWLNDLFSPVLLGREVEQYKAAMSAFEDLTGYFVFRALCKGDTANAEPFRKLTERIFIDYVGLTAMLKRFQRDAYGVKRFCDLAEGLVKAGKLQADARDTVIESVCSLGLRITAEEPRKTRIATAFSLWMCVFRPVSIYPYHLITSADLELFCANLNYWLATTFLLKFPGSRIDLGNREEENIRLARIQHDFTYREVGMSTMETLYSSIFRLPNDNGVQQNPQPVAVRAS
jgi:hypothetical protein